MKQVRSGARSIIKLLVTKSEQETSPQRGTIRHKVINPGF